MRFAQAAIVTWVKPLLVASAAAAAALLVIAPRRTTPAAAPIAQLESESAPPQPAPAERPVRITEEIVTARLVKPAPIERRRPTPIMVARAQRRLTPPEPRTGFARWFLGDGTNRPAPFPRPQRSTVR
jgi:hypothetical protein